MFTRVIVPLDGSPLAQSALPYALALADAAGVPVTLLQVVASLATTLDFDWQYDASLEAAALARAYDALVPLAQSLHTAGRRVETQVLLGDPPAEILRYADRGAQDLVVMATHGQGGMLHWAFGSVARKVLTTTDTPLLIVRPSRVPEQPMQPAAIRSILVPLDGSARAETVLPLVRAVAKSGNAQVTLTRVVPLIPSDYVMSSYTTPSELTYLDEITAAARAAARKHLGAIAAAWTAAGVKTEAVVQTGEATHTLLETIASGGYDLVAMTTHGRTGLSRWVLGSVAERLIEGSHTPILLVRAGDETK